MTTPAFLGVLPTRCVNGTVQKGFHHSATWSGRNIQLSSLPPVAYKESLAKHFYRARKIFSTEQVQKEKQFSAVTQSKRIF